MECGVIFLIGALTGFIVRWALDMRTRPDGTLRIDRSIPEENPYLFLELSNAVDVVGKKKYAKFKVMNKNFISRK